MSLSLIIYQHLVLLNGAALTQSWWFRMGVAVAIAALLLEIYIWRIKSMRQKQQEKQELAEQMAELHARALRAQMNPHFIFNCLNSIKLLVQDQQNDKAVHYLNVFTKFIRSLMQNADKTHVSLHEELENCRLYLDMEGLRFQEHFTYTIQTDPQLDLKMIDVPVLLIQPLVENALWHGIMPRQSGGHIGISISQQDNDTLLCTVEDNGIGREASAKINKQQASHQSKGVSITQSRIGLHSLLKDEETTIQITDKKNDKGEATGTRVDITLQIN